MNFLIFIFIIISILSSLQNQVKKKNRNRKREREKFFDPWSFDIDSEIDILKEMHKKEDLKEGPGKKNIFLLEDTPELELPEEGEHSLEDILYPEEKGEFTFSTDVETKEEQTGISTLQYKKKEMFSTTYLEKGVATIFKDGQLPLAILFSEILGPPRAIKPFRVKKY